MSRTMPPTEAASARSRCTRWAGVHLAWLGVGFGAVAASWVWNSAAVYVLVGVFAPTLVVLAARWSVTRLARARTRALEPGGHALLALLVLFASFVSLGWDPGPGPGVLLGTAFLILGLRQRSISVVIASLASLAVAAPFDLAGPLVLHHEDAGRLARAVVFAILAALLMALGATFARRCAVTS